MGKYNADAFAGEAQSYITKTCKYCDKNCPHEVSVISGKIKAFRCTVCENTGEPYAVITDG
jgi:flavoprotein